MESILQGLHDLEGVHGAMVIDGGGQLLAHRAHSIYNLELLEQATRAIVSAIDAVKLVQEDWEAITTHFSEGKLLIRNAASGGDSVAFTLTLIADARLNPSFATVAIRVAMGKLKAALQAGDGNAAAGQSGAGGRVTGGAAGSARGQAKPGHASVAQPKASMTEVANTGLSWSGLGSSSMSASGSEITVADAASSAVLTACTKALAQSVGPMAKLFVKEAVRKVCPNRPFSKENVEALVTELAKCIESPNEATQFRKSLLKAL